MSDFQDLYEVRDMKSSDKNFIFSTFLNGLYYGDSWFSLIPKNIFMDNYKKVIQALLVSPNAIVKVACLKDAPDAIIGYSILSSDFSTIHWVYVKSSKLADGSTWRKHGIAKSLVPQYPAKITHLTTLGRSLMIKFKDVVFDPFAIN